MARAPRVLTIAIITLVASGCSGSVEFSGDAGGDIALDGGPDASVDTGVDPDADVTLQCIVDDDCVVALREDRCCTPDPVAVPASELLFEPCLHALGEAWIPSGEECSIPCAECVPITERFYAARCVDGACVGVEDFCPPMDAPEPVAEFWSPRPPEGGWQSLRAQVVEVRGEPILGPDSCACCFECLCDCFDNEVHYTLDCEITIRGSVCSEPWECSGTECDPTCTPPEILSWRELIRGYLVDTELEGWEIWALNKTGDCPPAGPNPEGGRCTPFEDSTQCADGLECFYWGDVIDNCVGTCRPWGDECETEDDCEAGDYCYMGYCVWCCPG